jgi:hypothetical protein
MFASLRNFLNNDEKITNLLLKKLVAAAHKRKALALLLTGLLVLSVQPAFAQLEVVLYNFCTLQGTCPDGAGPVSSLTPDGEGNFYGTTLNAGWTFGSFGNVFELIPNGNGGLDEITLHHFTGGTDGGHPRSSLLLDNAGNLYGTASDGGTHGYGVVFELSRVGSDWNETVLYNFTNGADSGVPWTNVIRDQAGNLYGATAGGTPTGSGGVYELSPSDGGWSEQIIYSFNSNAILPSGLTMDGNGNIFGAAGLTIFELLPNGGGGWNPSVIYTFAGKYPSADSTPVLDQQGNIFGTIQLYSKLGPTVGHVYKLSQTDSQWGLQILAGWEKGTGPVGGLVLDDTGNVYGTSVGGGVDGDGTVFELQFKNGHHQKKVLWNFNGLDGESPVGGLILENGTLYGTTALGGTQGFGTAFEIIP